MGLHADTLHPNNVVMIAKYLVVAEILYVFNLVWTKLGILLMYYRIFRFPYFKLWAYIVGTFVILWVICITFLFIFICVPVQKLWYPYLEGRCINQVGTWISNAVSTIVTDLIILCLPIPQVWSLQLRRSEKMALTLAFGLGFLYVSPSCVRLSRSSSNRSFFSVVFASAYRFSVLFSYDVADSSYTLAPTVGWTAIEMSAGIVSACLPTLRPALQFAARLLHIKGTLPALLRSRSMPFSKGSQSDPINGPQSVDKNTAGTAADHHGSRANRHSFYHLPDESDPGREGGLQRQGGAAFRPDYDNVHMVTNVLCPNTKAVQSGETDSLSGDEIPLHGIRVQKDFSQVNN